MSDRPAPEALLLISSHCTHCPTALAHLGELVKAGDIERLEVINIERRPQLAEALGVRSVPWVRLGPFELTGVRGLDELRGWAAAAGTPQGLADYLRELLKEGELAKANTLVEGEAENLVALVGLLGAPDIELSVRIGIGAIVEGLEEDPRLAAAVDTLVRLTEAPEAAIRGDAAHLLSYTHSPRAEPLLHRMTHDLDPDVREIAAEGLARLKGA